MPTWTAVTADWTAAMGPGFMALFEGGFIQSGKVFADGYPCIRTPPCGCYHARVGSTLCMACTCEEPDCRDFTVTEEQLRLHSLNTLRLADALRRALSVKGPSRTVRDIPSVYALGTYHPAPQTSYPVFLLAPSGYGDHLAALAELVLSHDKKVGIVLLSRAGLDSRIEKSLAGQVQFVFLPETAILTVAGQVELLPGVRDPLRAIHSPSGETAAENDLVRLVQVARQLPRRPGLKGPHPLDALAALLDGHTHTRIAKDHKCSRPLVSEILKQIQAQSPVKLSTLVGRGGDLRDIVKRTEDSRARRIHQPSAASGREEEFDR